MKINDRAMVQFSNGRTIPDKEGWLWKKGELNTSYQKRWCILKGNLLFYCEKRFDKEPVGVVVLENCTVQLAEGGDSPYTFSIIFLGEGMRTYKFVADDDGSCKEWIRSLSLCSYRYFKILVDDLINERKEFPESSEMLQIPALPVLSPSPKIGRSPHNGEENTFVRHPRAVKKSNDQNNDKTNVFQIGNDDAVMKIVDSAPNGVKIKTLFYKNTTPHVSDFLKAEYSGRGQLKNKVFMTACSSLLHCHTQVCRPFAVLHESHRRHIQRCISCATDETEICT